MKTVKLIDRKRQALGRGIVPETQPAQLPGGKTMKRGFDRRPNRTELLAVIFALQNLIGRAKGAYQDDRSPDRAERVLGALRPAFELCIAATAWDPPRRRGKAGG